MDDDTKQAASGAGGPASGNFEPDTAPAALSRADVDSLVYQCRQAGDDSTYALVRAIEQSIAGRRAAPSAASHLGDSGFEGWFSRNGMAHLSTKQLARDAYAAGMNDPAACEAEGVCVEPVTALQLSAPKRIYLDIGERLDAVVLARFDMLEGVSWSEDNATNHGIPYIRGDLASSADETAATADALADLRALLSEVSACFTRDDDLPNELLPRIDKALRDGAPG